MAESVVRTESQASMLIGIAVGFIAVSGFIILLRIYTRILLLRVSGADDYSILVAMAFSIVVSVSTCMEAKYGMGRHVEAVSQAATIHQLTYLHVSILNYNVGMNVVKISFLFQYRRIFESPLVQKVCLYAMAYVALWTCTQATLLGISCLPISFLVPSTADWCLNTLPVWYFSSAMSLATDLLIFCIALPSVIRLVLPLRQKIIVIMIFCLGFFVCIISVYRMCTLRAAVESKDPPWDNVGAAIWSVIELNCAIVCASLPTLRPLLAKVVPGLSSNYSNRATYERYGSQYAVSSNHQRHAPMHYNVSHNTAQSISTEELALTIIEPGGRKALPSAYVEGGRRDLRGNLPYQDPRQILVTTETSVRKH